MIGPTCLPVLTMILLFVIIQTTVTAPTEVSSSLPDCLLRRAKRSLPDLSDMISAVLKTRNGVDYMGYGNYCGIGGAGTPLDAIDTCCQHHDQCYHRITVRGDCAHQRGFHKDFLNYHWHLKNDSTVSCGKCRDLTWSWAMGLLLPHWCTSVKQINACRSYY